MSARVVKLTSNEWPKTKREHCFFSDCLWCILRYLGGIRTKEIVCLVQPHYWSVLKPWCSLKHGNGWHQTYPMYFQNSTVELIPNQKHDDANKNCTSCNQHMWNPHLMESFHPFSLYHGGYGVLKVQTSVKSFWVIYTGSHFFHYYFGLRRTLKQKCKKQTH